MMRSSFLNPYQTCIREDDDVKFMLYSLEDEVSLEDMSMENFRG